MQTEKPKGEPRRAENRPAEEDREAHNRSVWKLAFKIEERLKRHRFNISEELQSGKAAASQPDTPAYYLVQKHGPFATRGEALSRGLDLLFEMLSG